MGVAPISDPEVVVLVTLYNPTGEGGHQGGAWGILATQIVSMIKNAADCERIKDITKIFLFIDLLIKE